LLDPLDHLVARGLGVAPGAKPRDHPGSHGFVGDEARRRAAARVGRRHVRGICLGDLAPAGVVGEPGCEGLEETGDGGVGDLAHLREGVRGAAHGACGDRLFCGGYVQEVARVLHDHQPVAWLERRGQLRADIGDPIAAEWHRLAGRKRLQPPLAGRTGFMPCAAVVHASPHMLRVSLT
jgi:hypothetical protein